MISFTISFSNIRNNIFVPKYYDPEIQKDIENLKETHDILSISELVCNGVLEVKTGHELGKMAYGTGNIPFIRTSDLTNWELKTIPKQGVSQEYFDDYSNKQDVAPGDILMVKDGDYLIGSNCMILQSDLPLLFQSHILKFRVKNPEVLDPYLFFIVLNSEIVQRQIRNVQFTADIIDTIGTRYLEIKIPIPKNIQHRDAIVTLAKKHISSREIGKIAIKQFPMLIEDILEVGSAESLTKFFRMPYEEQLSVLSWNTIREEFGDTSTFSIKYSDLENRILLPKYYNPELRYKIDKLSDVCDLLSIGDLVKSNRISLSTGVEIGKQCYGTGNIPFIRTSDFSNWELKVDAKQSVSSDVFNDYKDKTDVRPGDIFLVRDGSYLIGTTCLITEKDPEVLFCGGIYKIRSNDESLDPYLLLGLLNSYLVRQQIRTKQFTRDVIDTIGKRLMEVIVPIPKDKDVRKIVSSAVYDIVQKRIEDRDCLLKIASMVIRCDDIHIDDF